MVKIGFDIGGVLTKYPEVFRPMLEALLAHPGIEVHVLTDIQGDRARRLVQENGYNVPAERIHSCDLAKYGNACKAEKVKELGIAMMIDDHPPYLANMPCGRMYVMPDTSRLFFDPSINECR